MKDSILTEDFKNKPYWWDLTPRTNFKNIELPKKTEVLIIGSGYTGICAAIQTSRNGLDTLV